MKPLRFLSRERLPELGLIASILLLLALGGALAEGLPSWHEIVSALPNNGYRVLAPDTGAPATGPLPLQPSCVEPGAPLFAVTTARPHLSLCASGQALPVMVTPYAAGFTTWPLALLRWLHHNDTFAVRKLWLCVAALSLVLTFRLVSRLADRPTAALACLLTASSSPFLVINGLLVPFETVPGAFVVAALSIWTGCSALRPGAVEGARAPTGRLALGALLAGLALAANVKAAFLLAPLAVLALRSGVRMRAVRPWQAAAMAAAVLAPTLPMLIFAQIDPQRGLAEQVSRRASHVLENLTLSHFASEPLALLNFTTDFMSYLDLAARRQAIQPSWLFVVAALPLAACVVAFVARLAGRPLGSVPAAACGGMILTFFVVSVLLYQQYPGGNYAPLHDVVGVATAVGAVDLARGARGALDRRGLGGPRAGLIAVSLAAVLAGGSLWNVLRRGDPAAHVAISINAAAERSLAAHLLAMKDVDRPVLTTTYNHAGVIDALCRGRVRAIQAHEHFERCDGKREPVDACMLDRWRWILGPEGAAPLRVIVPLEAAAIDHPAEAIDRLGSSLVAASRELGLSARVEERFSTAAGTPVIALYRVDREPGAVPRVSAAPRLPPKAASGECAEAISAGSARALFDALRALDAGDGCRLKGVSTERTTMRVQWEKDGRPIEPARILPTTCAETADVRGEVFSISIPAAAASECPGTIARLRTLFERETFGGTVKNEAPPAPGVSR
jgi:hypothetical protein